MCKFTFSSSYIRKYTKKLAKKKLVKLILMLYFNPMYPIYPFQDINNIKINKIGWAQWRMLVIPTLWQADNKVKRLRPSWPTW